MLKAPCKYCEDRCVGCHCKCVRYKTYKEACQALCDKISEETQNNENYYSVKKAVFKRTRRKR